MKCREEAAISDMEASSPPPIIERPITGKEFSLFPEFFISFQSQFLAISW